MATETRRARTRRSTEPVVNLNVRVPRSVWRRVRVNAGVTVGCFAAFVTEAVHEQLYSAGSVRDLLPKGDGDGIAPFIVCPPVVGPHCSRCTHRALRIASFEFAA